MTSNHDGGCSHINIIGIHQRILHTLFQHGITIFNCNLYLLRLTIVDNALFTQCHIKVKHLLLYDRIFLGISLRKKAKKCRFRVDIYEIL